MAKARIALVEDDPQFVMLVSEWLTTSGYHVDALATGSAARQAFATQRFDLYLIDWRLPDMTGDVLLAELRSALPAWAPIIFVTVHDGEEAILSALRRGCDDYIIKPPRRLELLARVEGLLRRMPTRDDEATLLVPPYRFDAREGLAYLRQSPIDLTGEEMQLAIVLFGQVGALVARQTLAKAVWGKAVPARQVDDALSRLRRKLAIEPANGFRLALSYGYGYRLERMGDD